MARWHLAVQQLPSTPIDVLVSVSDIGPSAIPGLIKCLALLVRMAAAEVGPISLGVRLLLGVPLITAAIEEASTTRARCPPASAARTSC